MKEFLERFDSIPDMLELDHLTVSGDVTFGKGVSLKVCIYMTSKFVVWSSSALSYSHFTFFSSALSDFHSTFFYTLQGTVIIIANHGERIDIPPRALLENKIVSGNLRIRDH